MAQAKYDYKETRNGALLLLLLLRQGCKTWADLCARFEYADAEDLISNTTSLTLYQTLSALRDVGLVQFKDEVVDGKPRPGEIEVEKRWADIRVALGGIPLKDLARLPESARGMGVTPVFGTPASRKETLDVFVAMPFKEELRPVYDDWIKKVCKKLNKSVRRGDDLFTAAPMISKVWDEINTSRVVIADCTGKNANVFYELGLAHVVGKPVVLITQNKDDMPVDVVYIQYIVYEYTPPGMKSFEKKLTEALKQLLGPGE